MKLTIKEIADWIDNDEGLYHWWKGSKQSKRQFIEDNRAELEANIRRVLDGTKRPHYLIYS